MHYKCVFYRLNNKSACFCNSFLLGLYYFTKTDFLKPQSVHIDFCAINLFTTCFGVIDLSPVSLLHFKLYVFCFLMGL